MGVPVSFAGVSRYSDDGQPILGLFDRPIAMQGAELGYSGVDMPRPEVRLPYNAFNPMPASGDALEVDGTEYTVASVSTEDDGAFTCYGLKLS